MTGSENIATNSNHKMLIWSLTLTSYILITWPQRSIRGPMRGHCLFPWVCVVDGNPPPMIFEYPLMSTLDWNKCAAEALSYICTQF